MYNSRESKNRYGVKVEQDKSGDNINNKKKRREVIIEFKSNNQKTEEIRLNNQKIEIRNTDKNQEHIDVGDKRWGVKIENDIYKDSINTRLAETLNNTEIEMDTRAVSNDNTISQNASRPLNQPQFSFKEYTDKHAYIDWLYDKKLKTIDNSCNLSLQHQQNTSIHL